MKKLAKSLGDAFMSYSCLRWVYLTLWVGGLTSFVFLFPWLILGGDSTFFREDWIYSFIFIYGLHMIPLMMRSKEGEYSLAPFLAAKIHSGAAALEEDPWVEDADIGWERSIVRNDAYRIIHAFPAKGKTHLSEFCRDHGIRPVDLLSNAVAAYTFLWLQEDKGADILVRTREGALNFNLHDPSKTNMKLRVIRNGKRVIPDEVA